MKELRWLLHHLWTDFWTELGRGRDCRVQFDPVGLAPTEWDQVESGAQNKIEEKLEFACSSALLRHIAAS
jgi:hypothetical protein